MSRRSPAQPVVQRLGQPFSRSLRLGAAGGFALAVGVLGLSGAAFAQEVSGCQPQSVTERTASGGPQRACGVAGANALAAQVAGPVILQRAGRVVALARGEVLRAGDRVLSRSGTARITLGEACEISLPASSVATIGGGSDGFCLTQREVGPVSGQTASTPSGAANTTRGLGSSPPGASGGGASGGFGLGSVGAGAGAGLGPSAPALAAIGGVSLVGVAIAGGSSKGNRLSP